MRISRRLIITCFATSFTALITGCPSEPSVAGSGAGGFTPDDKIDFIDWPSTQVDPGSEDTAGFNQVISADLDGDGLLDLVTAASESQPIQLHLQQRSSVGTISFDSFSVAGSGPIVKVSSLRVADMDLDGNLDIVLSSQDNGFAPANECAEQQCSLLILFAPPNPRDALDWERYNLTYNHRCRLINNTPFTFDTVGFDGNAMCYASMDVGDVNGDGFPDVVAALNGCDDPTVPTKQVEVWFNPGRNQVRDFDVLLGSTLIDSDFDGVPDNCVADVDRAWSKTILQQDVVDIGNVQLSDIDIDGDLDVVAVRPDSKTFDLTWQANPSIPNGTVTNEFWGGERLHPIGESDAGFNLIDIGDLDKDGLADVVALSQGDRVVRWFRRPPDPAAQEFPWQVYNLVQFTELIPTAVDIADVDLNGQNDVVAAAGGRIRWFTPVATSPFVAWSEAFVTDDPTSEINSVHAVDINADGRLDIAATFDRPGVDEDALIWLTNEGDNER